MTNYLDTNFDVNSQQMVELFDELPIWAAPFGLALLDEVRLKRNITALDIGFGAGFPLTELAMRLGKSCRVYGIDPWEAAIKRAEKKINFYGIENVNIIRGVAENIPLPDKSVDLIVSNNGINNVSDLQKVLSECSRIMKSGGQFLMTMNLNTSLNEFYEIMECVLIRENMNQEIEKMHLQIYEKRKPLTEMYDLLNKNDFNVVQLHNHQFNYKFIDGTAMLNHYFIRLAFLDGWKSIIPTDKHKMVFMQIEDKMNEKANSDGFFLLSVPFVVMDCKRK